MLVTCLCFDMIPALACLEADNQENDELLEALLRVLEFVKKFERKNQQVPNSVQSGSSHPEAMERRRSPLQWKW